MIGGEVSLLVCDGRTSENLFHGAKKTLLTLDYWVRDFSWLGGGESKGMGSSGLLGYSGAKYNENKELEDPVS